MALGVIARHQQTVQTNRVTVIIDQFVISAALSSFDWQSQKLARF